jgi:hypothetical protein
VIKGPEALRARAIKGREAEGDKRLEGEDVNIKQGWPSLDLITLVFGSYPHLSCS